MARKVNSTDEAIRRQFLRKLAEMVRKQRRRRRNAGR